MNDNRTSIGKYDFIKGIAMILIIIYHTRESYSFEEGTLFYTICLIFDSTIQTATNGIFSLLGGISIRKRPIVKMIKMQFNSLIKPYIYTGVARSFFLLVINFLFFRYLPGAITESLRSLLGFVFGLQQSTEIMGFLAYECGPMWFFLSMSLSLCILNIAINYIPKKYFLLSNIGIIILLYFISSCFYDASFYTLNMLFYSYLMSFLGYYLKQRNFFNQKILSLPNILLYIVTIGITIFNITATIPIDSFMYFIIDLINVCLWSISLCQIVFNIKIKENKLIDIVSSIGRYSLYILCIHTVEKMAIPWYLFSRKFSATPIIGFFLQLAIRGLLIYIVYVVINYIKYKKSSKILESQQ